MKSLVVGMGIGNLYKAVLEELGYQVITVDADPAKNAMFSNVDMAISTHGSFETAHVCTPNFTHEALARKLAPVSKIVFVEKPGVISSAAWAKMVSDFPGTRFMMVKNNQYRDEIKKFKDQADQASIVRISWNNENRIPSPGSWFTTKELAFGGVSRDLLPHMLSYYCVLADVNKGSKLTSIKKQNWQLDDITSTDYGVINPHGTYDVDDYCEIEFVNGKTKWILEANWRSLQPNTIEIAFGTQYSAVRYELGLCPENAYQTMIERAVDNLDNDKFWQDQLDQDIWIHYQIDNL